MNAFLRRCTCWRSRSSALIAATGKLRTHNIRGRRYVLPSKSFLSSTAGGGDGVRLQLTSSLRVHLSRLLEQYSALVKKAHSPESHHLSEHAHRGMSRSLSELEKLTTLVKELDDKRDEILELKNLADTDTAMEGLAMEEIQKCTADIERIEASIVKALIPKDEADTHSAILEVRAGVGGKEASLFTAEIFHMYQRFALYKEWKFEELSVHKSETGGYRDASASLTGHGVFGIMKHESGVHRVQRVPVTEVHGRMHTSTMSVVILPQPSEVDVEINPSEIKVDTFRAGGAGGQHVNTTDSAVRMTHLPTGISVNMQDERSQHRNRAKALQVLRARVYEVRRREVEEERSQNRRQQIGSLERSERIRTYNFPQDRVTDHRLGRTVHSVDGFLSGCGLLEGLVAELQALEEAKALDALTHKLTDELQHNS